MMVALDVAEDREKMTPDVESILVEEIQISVRILNYGALS